MIDRLVNGGLVKRSHSPTDGRSVLVSLTAKGASLLEHLASQHAKELLEQEPLLAESLMRLRQLDRTRPPRRIGLSWRMILCWRKTYGRELAGDMLLGTGQSRLHWIAPQRNSAALSPNVDVDYAVIICYE